MKVLMIIAHPEFGGTETHVLSLGKALHKYGIRIGVATYNGPFVPILRKKGIRVHKISHTTLSSSSRAASRVASIAKKHGYDVIHAHDSESFRMLPYLYRQIPDVPRVMTVHGNYYSKESLRRAVKYANEVMTVSPAVRQRVMRLRDLETKVTWVPNGIDVKTYSPAGHRIRAKYRRTFALPRDTKICLYAGRFQSDKWKIAQKFILASEQVARKNSKVASLLVGFGSYRHQLSQLARQVNKRLGRTVVRVLPPTIHMEKHYRAATLVVGTGRVALEAMSCGKPVITAGISGYEGIVGPKTWTRSVANQFGDHGATKPTTIRGLANDMYKLLANPRLMKFTGDFGRKMVRHQFSIIKVAKTTSHVYRSVAHRSKNP